MKIFLIAKSLSGMRTGLIRQSVATNGVSTVARATILDMHGSRLVRPGIVDWPDEESIV
jgi:hypothetical protein